MAEEKKLSDASDKTEAVIWDENNVLVDPELNAHFNAAREAVLRPIEEGTLDFDFDAPRRAQSEEGRTKDPTTSPQPTADPNTRPPLIEIGSSPAENRSTSTTSSNQPQPENPPSLIFPPHTERDDE